MSDIAQDDCVDDQNYYQIAPDEGTGTDADTTLTHTDGTGSSTRKQIIHLKLVHLFNKGSNGDFC